jgi:hypothetical protein
MKKKLSLIYILTLIIGITVSSNVYAIKNGSPDAGNDWPYVCWIVGWDGVSNMVYLSSGSLIAPDVVLCAGHATAPEDIAFMWVTFLEQGAVFPPFDVLSLPSVVTEEGWIEADLWDTYDGYCMGCGSKGLTDWLTGDVGIIILSEEVDLEEYAELPEAGLVDTLSMKEDVDIVGYGVQYQIHGGGPPSWSFIEFGYRYYSTAQFISGEHIMSDNFMMITANPGQGKGGTCYGDSGSPILLAGTNTVLGVCSWGTNGNCAGISFEQRVDIPEILTWINGFLT